MKALMLSLLAAALLIPLQAAAAAPALEAPNFDGARSRPEGAFVTAGPSTDGRTAAQIAKDEQLKADARAGVAVAAPTPGPDAELAAPKPNEWLKSGHIISGVKGAIVGLLVGSLWGLTGLGIGLLIGGLIGYGLSKLTA